MAVPIPNDMVGLIIGRGGSMINSLQQKTNTRIQASRCSVSSCLLVGFLFFFVFFQVLCVFWRFCFVRVCRLQVFMRSTNQPTNRRVCVRAWSQVPQDADPNDPSVRNVTVTGASEQDCQAAQDEIYLLIQDEMARRDGGGGGGAPGGGGGGGGGGRGVSWTFAAAT